MYKGIFLLAFVTLMSACATTKLERQVKEDTVTFASFNVSFAVDGDPTDNYQRWVEFMSIPHSRQAMLIEKWRSGDASEEEHTLAERVIQIRNVAAIIQIVRPDVLLLNEFNNDGYGRDLAALEGFQNNYLAHGQYQNSLDGGKLLNPILYPHMQSYATNTGLDSGLDLANDGYDPDDPNDAHGFGFYHGQYAFALLSKYEIDDKNTRSFQTFKRRDLPKSVVPVINVCRYDKPLPEGMACGDHWYTPTELKWLRLSSKNHVDAPIKIPTSTGTKTIHALLSHPTPPAFDSFSDNNKYRNSDENRFWGHYINREASIYDDKGNTTPFAGDYFVIMGDLNADNAWGRTTDERFNGIQTLMNDPKINQKVSQATGEFAPTSLGGENEPNTKNHPFPSIRTATFGTRADYAVPSATLNVVDSGVFWQAEGEQGRALFNDKRLGDRGTDKQVSSDHRLVWVTIAL